MTMIFFARPSLMYFAIESNDLSFKLRGGTSVSPISG